MKILETDRLKLRSISLSDAELLFKGWANDTETMWFLPPYYNNKVDTVYKWIDECIDGFRRVKRDSWEMFALVIKSSNEVIGIIELDKIDYVTRSAEAGYHLCKKWWGNGYAAEALRELLRFSFNELNLNRIHAAYDPRNPNSGRVMQKAGMLYEGTLRQCEMRNGVLVDRIYYAMLREDYLLNK